MKKLILFLLLSISCFGQYKGDLPASIIKKTEIQCDTIYHEYHTILYSRFNNVPQYVEYSLYPENYKKLKNYKGYFVKDPDYRKEALSKYYSNSGYDRGHLFPAEDASYDEMTFSESYYETNMVPQKPECNRGIWKKLENKLRKLSKKDTLDIITGPDIFGEPLIKINNKIFLPSNFFKIVVNYSKNTLDIYYIPNDKSSKKVEDYLITVEEFESKCGIYFNRDFISLLKCNYATKKY